MEEENDDRVFEQNSIFNNTDPNHLRDIANIGDIEILD